MAPRSRNTRNRSPLATPVDIRLMEATATAVFALAGLVLLAAMIAWAARAPAFTLRAIALDGDLARSNLATLRANALPRLTGNFFSFDLERGRAAFESVPWVRRAVVRKVWPMKLSVQLEEHRPVALWAMADGNDRLVNSFGEVFEANVGDVEDDELPRLAGPEGSAPLMLAMQRRLQPVLAPLGAGDMAQLTLSARGSWRVELDKGAAIELGRGSEDEVLARTEHFVRTLPRVVAKYQRPLESADLRHTDGFALRLKGVATNVPAVAARKR